jgi:hypothetical protein
MFHWNKTYINQKLVLIKNAGFRESLVNNWRAARERQPTNDRATEESLKPSLLFTLYLNFIYVFSYRKFLIFECRF